MTQNVVSISESVEHAYEQPAVPSLDSGAAADAASSFFASLQEFIDSSEWDKNSVWFLARSIIGCIDRKVAYIEEEGLPKKAQYLQDLMRASTRTEIDMTKFDEVHMQAATMEATAHAFAELSLNFKQALADYTGQPYRPYTEQIDNRAQVAEYHTAEMSAVADKFSKYLK